MRSPIFLAIPLILALSMPASADECVPTTSVTDADTIVLDTTTNDAVVHYVAIDVCQPGCTLSAFAYRELNGIPGLQRNDDRVDDTCGGAIESDGFEL